MNILFIAVLFESYGFMRATKNRKLYIDYIQYIYTYNAEGFNHLEWCMLSRPTRRQETKYANQLGTTQPCQKIFRFSLPFRLFFIIIIFLISSFLIAFSAVQSIKRQFFILSS